MTSSRKSPEEYKEMLQQQKVVLTSLTEKMRKFYVDMEMGRVDLASAFPTLGEYVRDARKDLKDSISGDTVFSVEYMRLFLDQEKQTRKKNNEPPLNAYVVKRNELEGFVEKINDLQNSSNLPIRLQLLVENNNHYTTMDFLVNKDGVSCIILDAAYDTRGLPLPAVVKNVIPDCAVRFAETYDKKGEGVGIQHDPTSCPMFAYDHACKISRMDNIHDLAAQKGEADSIDWHELPADLIMHAQSYSFLKEYNERHAKDSNPMYHTCHQRDAAGKHVEIPLEQHVNSGENKRVIGVKSRAAIFARMAGMQTSVTINRATDHVYLNQNALLESSYGKGLEALSPQMAKACYQPAYMEPNYDLENDFKQKPVVNRSQVISASSLGRASAKEQGVPEVAKPSAPTSVVDPAVIKRWEATPLSRAPGVNGNDPAMKVALDLLQKHEITTIGDVKNDDDTSQLIDVMAELASRNYPESLFDQVNNHINQLYEMASAPPQATQSPSFPVEANPQPQRAISLQDVIDPDDLKQVMVLSTFFRTANIGTVADVLNDAKNGNKQLAQVKEAIQRKNDVPAETRRQLMATADEIYKRAKDAEPAVRLENNRPGIK